MKDGYKHLGDYIRQVDIRNTDGKEENLLGVSVQKQFIPSIANTVGTDFTKYKVVKKGQFTYIPDTSRRGDKIGIALLKDYEEGLVSNVYTVFEVVDTEKLLPEYLMLWFSRPEFDRYARYKSHGSVREIFDWNEMCMVELPVPAIEEQRKIVKAYKAITDRIALKKQINDNLDASALAIYRKYFVEGIKPDDLPLGWSMGTLKDIYQFQYGKGNTNPDNGGQYPIYGSNGVIGGYHEYNNENEPVIGHIGAAGSLNFAFGKHYVTYNGIMCNILVPRNIYFGYLTLYAQNLAAQVRGSTQPFISYDMLYEIKTVLPTDEVLDDFHSKISPIMEHKREILSEITKLEQMQIIMQEQLSSF